MTAERVCLRAADLVAGERAKTHGDKNVGCACIARLWEGWLYGRKLADPCRPSWSIESHDVACMMELLKVARRLTGTFNLDDYVDGAGWAGVAGEIQEGLNKVEQADKDIGPLPDLHKAVSNAPPPCPDIDGDVWCCDPPLCMKCYCDPCQCHAIAQTF